MGDDEQSIENRITTMRTNKFFLKQSLQHKKYFNECLNELERLSETEVKEQMNNYIENHNQLRKECPGLIEDLHREYRKSKRIKKQQKEKLKKKEKT